LHNEEDNEKDELIDEYTETDANNKCGHTPLKHESHYTTVAICSNR